jgi:hypothetical protein
VLGGRIGSQDLLTRGADFKSSVPIFGTDHDKKVAGSSRDYRIWGSITVIVINWGASLWLLMMMRKRFRAIRLWRR